MGAADTSGATFPLGWGNGTADRFDGIGGRVPLGAADADWTAANGVPHDSQNLALSAA